MNDLAAALEDIRQKKLSVRAASAAHGVPKSIGKACEKYKLANPGIPLTKYTFARVFKDAWADCVKMSTFVNAFRQSGICPLNRHAINEAKLLPSLPFSSKPVSQSHPTGNPPQAEALDAIESEMRYSSQTWNADFVYHHK
jgi:hypothetical protein